MEQKLDSDELERKISLHYGVCKLTWGKEKPNVNYEQRDEDVLVT